MTGFIPGSYSFHEKDPLIDYVRTAIQDSGKSLKQISDESHVGIATIYKWIYGQTKKPQAGTLQAVLLVCGYELVIAKSGTKSVIAPTKFTPPIGHKVKSKVTYVKFGKRS